MNDQDGAVGSEHMKWFYKWRYQRHLFKSVKYQDPKFKALFDIHIAKMRYYGYKIGKN